MTTAAEAAGAQVFTERCQTHANSRYECPTVPIRSWSPSKGSVRHVDLRAKIGVFAALEAHSLKLRRRAFLLETLFADSYYLA